MGRLDGVAPVAPVVTASVEFTNGDQAGGQDEAKVSLAAITRRFQRERDDD
jgi:hypothetical protein